MDQSFSLKSPLGNFDLTPDQECQMVYIQKHRDRSAPQIQAGDIPSWCFDRDTIWFYFSAPEAEDKVEAGEKIKSGLLQVMHR